MNDQINTIVWSPQSEKDLDDILAGIKIDE